MMETIVFPDALALALDYLAAARPATGDSATKFLGRPTSDERQVVGVLVDSEVRQIVMQRSTLRFDAYCDETLGKQEAHDLGQWCRGALGAMQGTVQAGSTVYKVVDGSPGLNDSPDEISGKVRFSFYVVVTLRGEATGDETVLTTETGVPILVV